MIKFFQNLDYVGKRKLFGLISLCCMAVGIICMVIFGVQMDVTFKGGTMLKYSYAGDLDTDAFEKLAADTFETELSIGKSMAGETPTIDLYTTKKIERETIASFNEAAEKQFADNKIETLQTNALDANMGRKFFLKCMVAVVIAVAFLLIYIAFRFRKIGGWSAGLMAVTALLNDVLIAFFSFVIFGLELNDNFVAVILSILGYSLNATLVIFDRVRENKRLMSGASLENIVNTSIRQSFTRTFNTSLCTFAAIAVVVVMAFVMNVTSIISFALPMMFGIVAGFYSSVFLSGPLWVGLNLRLEKGRVARAAKNSGKPTKVKSKKKKTTRL